MKTIALSARVDELNELADHVPVSVLACRLLVVVEAYLQANKAPAGTEIMACAFRTLDAPFATHSEPATPVLRPPKRDEHFFVAPDVGTRVLLGEAAAEIAAHNEEGYDPEDVPPQVEEPVTTKPGKPAVGADTRRQSTTGMSNSTRDQDEESEKPCKDCGPVVGPKPLSEFYTDRKTKDGRRSVCKDCYRERQKAYEKKKRVIELPQPEERLCAAGIRCVKADSDDLVPTPAILDAANDHPSGLCGDCQKRAGVA